MFITNSGLVSYNNKGRCLLEIFLKIYINLTAFLSLIAVATFSIIKVIFERKDAL